MIKKKRCGAECPSKLTGNRLRNFYVTSISTHLASFSSNPALTMSTQIVIDAIYSDSRQAKTDNSRTIMRAVLLATAFAYNRGLFLKAIATERYFEAKSRHYATPCSPEAKQNGVERNKQKSAYLFIGSLMTTE